MPLIFGHYFPSKFPQQIYKTLLDAKQEQEHILIQGHVTTSCFYPHTWLADGDSLIRVHATNILSLFSF